MKRSALAGSVVVLGFLIAASCGDSSGGSGDKGGTTPNAGEAGDGGTGTGGGGKGGTAGQAGAPDTGGSNGKGGTGGAAGGGGEPTGGTSGDSGTAGAGDSGAGGEGGNGTGGTAGKGGTGGTGGMTVTCPTVDQFEESYSLYVCNKNADCCTGTDEATCASRVQSGLLSLYPGLTTSVSANQAELNCGDFIACMNAINAASCADWPKELNTDFGIPVNEPRCRTMIRGKIASGNGTNGNACTQNYQCINGYCTDPDSTGSQVKQCITFRGTGQACLTTTGATNAADATQSCNPTTHFCNDPEADGTGQCLPRFENAATCTAAEQCESRQCSSTCVRPTVCEWIPTPPAACAVSNVGARTGSLGWFAIAGMASLGAVGLRRRRRR